MVTERLKSSTCFCISYKNIVLVNDEQRKGSGNQGKGRLTCSGVLGTLMVPWCKLRLLAAAWGILAAVVNEFMYASIGCPCSFISLSRATIFLYMVMVVMRKIKLTIILWLTVLRLVYEVYVGRGQGMKKDRRQVPEGPSKFGPKTRRR